MSIVIYILITQVAFTLGIAVKSEWDFDNTFSSITNSTPIQFDRGTGDYHFYNDSYLNKPVLATSGSVFIVPSNSAGNGGGDYVNRYSMIFDIKISPTTAAYIPFFYTDADQRAVLNVLNDGSLAILTTKISAPGVVPFDTWVQIGLTADATNYNFRGFVNKNFVVSGYCSGGVDDTCSLFTMPNGYWLFNDDMGNYANVTISKLRFWNDTFTDQELLDNWGPLLNTTNTVTISDSTATSSATTIGSSSTSSSDSAATTSTTTSDITSSTAISSTSATTSSTTSLTSSSSTSSTTSSSNTDSSATTTSSTGSDVISSTTSTSTSGITSSATSSTTATSDTTSSSTNNSSTTTVVTIGSTATTTVSTSSDSTTSGSNSSLSGSPTNLATKSSSNNSQIAFIAGISAAGGVIVLLVIGAGISRQKFLLIQVLIFLLRRKRHQPPQKDPEDFPLQQRSSQLYTMQILTNITIGPKLGGGNFGQVYLGTWEGSEVACKKVSQDQAKEFQREANLLVGLQHPNVIRLLGLYIDNEDNYMVMELASKGSLKNLLSKEKNVSMKDMYDMMIATCKGMVYLESKGIIHRDLACRNILVSHVDGKYSCLVADFGLSRETSEYKTEGTLVPIRWSAPEVLKKQAVTSKSDVFSFGIVMHEILTFGETPYEFLRSNQAVAEYVCEGRRLPQLPTCPDALYEIMQKCWKENASERPSFKEILEMLVAIRGQDVREAAVDNQGAHYYKVMDERNDNYSTQKPVYTVK